MPGEMPTSLEMASAFFFVCRNQMVRLPGRLRQAVAPHAVQDQPCRRLTLTLWPGETNRGFVRGFVRTTEPITCCPRWSVRGTLTPGSSPSVAASKRPYRRLLATPMLGTSSRTPRWQAIPKPRGCACPCPSTKIRSGTVSICGMLPTRQETRETTAGREYRASSAGRSHSGFPKPGSRDRTARRQWHGLRFSRVSSDKSTPATVLISPKSSSSETRQRIAVCCCSRFLRRQIPRMQCLIVHVGCSKPVAPRPACPNPDRLPSRPASGKSRRRRSWRHCPCRGGAVEPSGAGRRARMPPASPLAGVSWRRRRPPAAHDRRHDRCCRPQRFRHQCVHNGFLHRRRPVRQGDSAHVGS